MAGAVARLQNKAIPLGTNIAQGLHRSKSWIDTNLHMIWRSRRRRSLVSVVFREPRAPFGGKARHEQTGDIEEPNTVDAEEEEEPSVVLRRELCVCHDPVEGRCSAVGITPTKGGPMPTMHVCWHGLAEGNARTCQDHGRQETHLPMRQAR